MTDNTTQPTTPVVSPLLALLRSRKALAALIGTLVNLAIVFLPPDVAPRINDMRGELVTAVTILIGLVIGGISYEDGAEKKAQQIPPITAGSGDVNVNTPPTSTTTPENFPSQPVPPSARYTHR